MSHCLRALRSEVRLGVQQLQQKRLLVSAADLQFGQPLHETHPHLLKPGQLTRGITAQEYADRRAKLAASLPRNSIAVLAAADVKYRSGAVFYEFHQDSNFFYLTGFKEPEALAVIEKTGDDDEHVFHMFVRPKDPRIEAWDGPRSGMQAAQDVFNADEVGDIGQVYKPLRALISGSAEVYTDIPDNMKPRSAFSRFFLGGSSAQGDTFATLLQKVGVKPLRPLMNELRVFKSPAEVMCMRKAGIHSGNVFTRAMARQWALESDLWAHLDYSFRTAGCEGSAYVPVVGGGQNGLSIHYTRNDAQLKVGEMVLVDAGGEWGGYITDITRSWPVSGTFSEPQRDLYQMILNVQKTCVALCREDADMSLDKLHRAAEEGLKDGLIALGFDMSGDALRTLFPHHVGHFIGLDVHDSPGYRRTGRLQANQCITIEPGVYVPDSERWPEQFRGLAIRIEDSICIEQDKPLVLTSEAIKEVADIEDARTPK